MKSPGEAAGKTTSRQEMLLQAVNRPRSLALINSTGQGTNCLHTILATKLTQGPLSLLDAATGVF